MIAAGLTAVAAVIAAGLTAIASVIAAGAVVIAAGAVVIAAGAAVVAAGAVMIAAGLLPRDNRHDRPAGMRLLAGLLPALGQRPAFLHDLPDTVAYIRKLSDPVA